jgi:N-acetylmuramoyl-L-alanine amidase
MADVVISSGHAKNVRGAAEYLDEVNEARRVVDRVAELLDERGVAADIFHDDTSDTQDENLAAIVGYHNSRERDLDVSVHFNAFQPTPNPMGTEVCYLSLIDFAADVSDAIAVAGDFIDRGPKKRTDLYFLNQTEAPAILIEVCFVDSMADSERYKKNFERICEDLAEAIASHLGEGEPGA